MNIRTFYWHDRVISRYKMGMKKLFSQNAHNFFRVGNSGDIFNRHLIFDHYHLEGLNIKDEGSRLLMIGSIANSISDGDVLCGIGAKRAEIERGLNCDIQGLRGPLSYDAFKRAGYEMRNVKFLMDPGLLLRFMVPDTTVNPKGIIFIPHYRERGLYTGRQAQRIPKPIRFVDIDQDPLRLASDILNAELVYTSSLHGIIFSHALGRPCVFVQPQTEEPIFKYQDYFSSVGINMPRALDDISCVKFRGAPISPATIHYRKEDFVFPSLDRLIDLKIAH